MMHTVRIGVRALPADFGIFRGVGIGGEKGQSPLRDCLDFWGSDVRAVTRARFLAKQDAGI